MRTQRTSAGSDSSWQRFIPGVLILSAFVSSGAWMVTRLPLLPLAKALNFSTVGFWLIAAGLGVVSIARMDKKVGLALSAVVAVIAAAFLAGGSHFQTAFYDLYGNMPLLQWAAYPVVFLLAAGIAHKRERIEMGLVAVVALGALLGVVAIYQALTIGVVFVYGTTAYSTTALVPLIPIGVVLAAGRNGVERLALYFAAAIVAAAVGVFGGSMMGALATVFAVLVSLAVHPHLRRSRTAAARIVSYGCMAVSGLLVMVMLWAQIPALSGRVVNPESVASMGKNVISRVQMWTGSQQMLTDRPMFGFGPSGYRVSAVEYLEPEALQFGPDREGSIDPVVYSPQSPHSLLWEIGTRLGVAGLLAFIALFGLWMAALFKSAREPGKTADIKAGLGAGFCAALFALLVNPTLFAIGLFAPVAAGLAIAPMVATPDNDRALPSWALAAFTTAGVLLIVIAAWLYVGESRMQGPGPDTAVERIEMQESVLRVLPGHPSTVRSLLEMRLLVAADDGAVQSVQAQVDAAPSYVHDFAPNLVSLAAYSLSQAERTGRSDLSWERAMLERAAKRMPPIPSLVAERLRLAVLSGDVEDVRAALPYAQRWGAPYPPVEGYIERAEQLLADE